MVFKHVFFKFSVVVFFLSNNFMLFLSWNNCLCSSHIASEILTFLNRLGIFESANLIKIKKKKKNRIAYQHDGAQQLSFSSKKVHIKTNRPSKKKDILAMLSSYFLRRRKMYHKKWRIPIWLFDKSRTQGIVKCHILNDES